MRGTGSSRAIFFVIWIIIGNFIYLNLFLAILLDSFDQQEHLFEQNTSKKIKKRRKLEALEQLNNSDADNLEKLRAIQTIGSTRHPLNEVPCDYSYGILSKRSRLRNFCYKISVSSWFENFVLSVIIVSSLKLVVETYFLDDPKDSVMTISLQTVSLMTTIVFFFEFLIHSISNGLLFDEKTYLRSIWNQLDFTILAISLLDIAFEGLSYLKVIRLLRTLKPLRFISHNISMKTVVSALVESLLAIINVGILLSVIWLIFAILGVSLFADKFNACSDGRLHSRELCEAYGESWRSQEPNFNNVGEALMTLFVLSTLERWPEIMYMAVDGRGGDLGPQKDYRPQAALYFLAFVFIVSFLCSKLFIGVIFMQFNKIKNDESNVFSSVLNKNQRKWIEIQSLIVKARPHFEKPRPPKNPIRSFCYRLSKHTAFEIGVLVCILLCMIQLAIYYEDASDEYLNGLEQINLVFTCIFSLECAIKITGLGRSYFASNWNIFDFSIVLASILDLLLSITSHSGL